MLLSGLTSAEVQERISQGKINKTDDHQGKTVKQIVKSNIFTFFNLLNVVFFILILSVGSFKNGLFMWVIIVNTTIGIIQEIRTKKILDNLKILTTSKARVYRDGEMTSIAVEELVTDDIISLKIGDQIPSDAVVIQGEMEVNESLLTGESDAIGKHPGDEIFSGSFVTAGDAVCKVIHVGKDNYMETITSEAKQFKKHNSQLRNSINTILHTVSIFIVPLCIALFVKVRFIQHDTFRSAVEQLVTSGIGMIPEGLILLTSLALTLGVLRLAKKRTVVQELYCIETLARVDVLCLDKTGTLTEGKIQVEQAVSIEQDVDLKTPFQNLLAVQTSSNATSDGLREYFGKSEENSWPPHHVIPFSSDRKYSGASFEEHGTYLMGAAQFLFPEGDSELEKNCQSYAAQGYRVIVLARSEKVSEDESIPEGLKAIGIVLMTDVIRNECANTLKFFKEQEVDIKIISGDDPVTVSSIAAKCGLENADKYADASTLDTDEKLQEAVRNCVVFGRVTPSQKKKMVMFLKQDGHTVGMTGDGVNDVLALKEADCSIAMASGSEAAKNTANIVLLDSDFSSMPMVVKEGRRVINNICNAASLYLIKTIFSIILTLGTLLFGQHYPFEAVQLSVMSGCAVGIPTFLLQQEPSFRKIGNDFMRKVFRNAVPAALYISAFCLLITNIATSEGVTMIDSREMRSTICVLGMGFIYFFMLKRIYSPMTTYRRIVTYGMEIIYYVFMIIGQQILTLTSISATGVVILIGTIALAPIVIDILEDFYDRRIGKYVQKMAERKQGKKNNAEKD